MKLLLDKFKFNAVEGTGALNTAEELNNDDTNDSVDDKTDSKIEIDETELETDDSDVSDEDQDEKITHEDEEDEVNDESEVEDEDEIADILSPFSKKKFELKFPGALKEFPQIERALNTATKYREIFPSVNDALEAQNNLERYIEIEKDLETGSSKGLLGALKEKDEKAFGNVIDNYLLNLRQIDENAYFHVLGNNVKDMVVAMAREAERSKNDDLLTAAKLLNEFTFGTAEFAPKAKFAKEEDPDKTKLETEKQTFAKERLETHQTELTNRVETQISKKINDFIDTKNQMTSYIKRNAVREANELVASSIENDKEFTKILDKLWERAARNNYSQESLGNIRRAYIAKANAYLPQAIKKVRAQALNGAISRNTDDVDRKGPLARGKIASPKVSTSSSKKEIPKDMSSRDFLMQD